MLFNNIHVSCDDRMKVRFVMNLCKFFSFIYFRFLGFLVSNILGLIKEHGLGFLIG